ncbi:MAG: TPMT family class I SAM-dependent methyltransferase [Bacteroidia bacterium]|jgi:thiopurine S-methyltransferase|nr:TPMT family class I SAM-dependent methyltransferase [Bacteroidia bacterium]
MQPKVALDKNYWDKRYQTSDFGWDLGEISPPLKQYFNTLSDKTLKILIPGAGNAYEAEYLFNNGFQNVFVCDFARSALDNLKKRCPDFPESQLLESDFFKLNEKGFDLIIEQTFFCAINPALRKNYFEKMYELLQTNGKLVGLLFDDVLNADVPPFGGSAAEYTPLFQNLFSALHFAPCTNSIPPRAGRELFIELLKKT